MWAILQALVALAGIVLTGKASFAGLAAAAQGQQDIGSRWLWLGYALLGLCAWLVVVFVLEPDGTRVDASRCT